MAELRTTPTETDKLPRSLNAFGLAVIFVAFGCPLAVLAGYLQPVIAFGNGVGAPVAFLAAGALLVIFQVGCLSMARHMKSPGAFYCYVAEGVGKPAALAGSFLANIAYIMFAVSGYVYLGLITVSTMTQLFGTQVLPWQVWGLIGFAVVTVLNLLRVDLSARVVAVFVVIETAIVALYILVVGVKGGPEGYSPASFAPTQVLSGGFGLAVLFALLTLIGVEAMAVFREEVKDPDRTVPRAAYGAITFIAIFFAAAAWAYIVAVGPSQAVDNARNAPVDSVINSIQSYIGSFVATLVSVLLVTSQLASCNSVQGASVRYFFTLGHDRVLPARLGRVHPRLQSPHVAVLVSIAISLALYLGLLAASRDVVLIYGALGGLGVMCMLPLMIGTCVAVILFFRRNPGKENIWKALIAPALALLGLIAVMIFVFLNLELLVLSATAGVYCALALLVVIAIGVVLAMWLRRHRPDVYQRIGRQAEVLT